MLEDENQSDEESSQPEKQRKIEDNLVENEGGSSNHLLEQPGNVIDNQEEPSGNTIENQEGVKKRERELKEEDDMMKKASEIRDNVENVKQNLGTM